MASPNTGHKNQSGMGQAANEMKGKAQDTASSLTDKAKDAAGAAADKAKNLAASAGQSASDAASQLGKKVDDASGSIGGGMKNLAGTVREKAPQGGMMGTAAEHAADALESTGRYIQEEKLSGVAGDVVDMLKDNPVLTICVGLGLGFVLAQLMPSSRRY